MKKITLLFLALSAVAFGKLESTIDVNVSAIVTNGDPSLTITDENGVPISALNFDHYMTATENAEDTLTRKIRVEGNTLQNDNLNSLQANFTNSTVPLFDESGSNTLNSNLEAKLGETITKVSNDLNAVDLEIVSNVTGKAVTGMYTQGTTQLTVTLNKVSTTPNSQ